MSLTDSLLIGVMVSKPDCGSVGWGFQFPKRSFLFDLFPIS